MEADGLAGEWFSAHQLPWQTRKFHTAGLYQTGVQDIYSHAKGLDLNFTAVYRQKGSSTHNWRLSFSHANHGSAGK
jgi:hypothetical protein